MNDVQPADADDVAPLRRYEHREKHRYYTIWMQEDLFGQLCFMRAWGGTTSRRGRVVTTPVADVTESIALMNDEVRRRSKRGYQWVR